MAQPPRILVVGAYGTFGRLLVRELLDTTDAHLILAGRSFARAAKLCRTLGGNVSRLEPLALDLADHAQVARAADRCFAVACTAGPFQRLDLALPAIAVQAGAHWLDIADYPEWIQSIRQDRALDAAAGAAGLAVLTGQSSVPALAGVLVESCVLRMSQPRSADVTLFIGGRNPKGAAAVASALESGLDRPAAVTLSTGIHTAYRLGGAQAALLSEALGLPTQLRVAFESALAGRVAAVASRVTRYLSPTSLRLLARALTAISLPLSPFGAPGGCLHAEVWDATGQRRDAAFITADQRLAILPCALAVESLLSGALRERGVLHSWKWLQPDEWISRLESRAIRFVAT